MQKLLHKIGLTYALAFCLLMLVFLLLMQYQMWAGSGNMRENFHLQQMINKQLIINSAKIKENNSLYKKILAFKSNSQGWVGEARYDLGMIKSGEDYFQFG